MDAPKIKKQSKNKIRVEFDRAPLWERLKGKYLSMNFLKNVIFKLFRLLLLLGVSFVILYPYFSKIADSFKTLQDFQDPTVIYISRTPTLLQYQHIIKSSNFFKALLNTFLVSATTALAQTLVCALIGYGLAKFKFRGRNIIFVIVIVTMMLPQELIQIPMKNFFWNFGVDHPIGKLLKACGMWKNADGFGGLRPDGFVPLYILSLTGFGFRNGLFIFLLRQFFTGVPDELEESAYMDGCTTFRTFFQIIIPLAVPMLVTVYIFAFSWQWTDDFYINTFFTSMFWENKDITVPFLSSGNFAGVTPDSLYQEYGVGLTGQAAAWDTYMATVSGTTTIFIAVPLIIAFIFLQNKIVQGIERSGIVG